MIIQILIIITLLSPLTKSTPTLTITPKTHLLPTTNSNITISWSQIPTPSHLDFLALYSPPTSQPHHYIGYFFLSQSPTWQTGSGSLTFPLTNLRSNYTFKIYRWTESDINYNKTDHDRNPLPRTKHLLVGSEEVGFERPHGPEQVHLSYGDGDGEMRVGFVSGDGGRKWVEWGEGEKGGGRERVECGVERYGKEDLCDAPANDGVGWRDPGFIHFCGMSGLKKGVKYFYKVGSDSGGWSPTYSFISRNEDSEETNAFLFGDMGTATPYRTFIRTQDESISTIKWILRDMEALGEKPAFVSHIGDLSYARGYSWIWDNFFNQIEPIASRLPYHVCIGNHEYDWPQQPWKPDWAMGIYNKDGGGECGVPYSLRFKMPGNSSFSTGTRAPPTRNLYYSFDTGSVHFVYMSTETDFLPGSAQYNFLKHDLENVNRKKTPFVVLQGHRPMYTTSNELRDAPIRQKMMEHLEPLLVKNNVTLALWGHVHRYERFCPLNNFTCGTIGEKQGGYPVHAVIGMAGQDWQPIWEPRKEHTDMPIFPQPERSIYRGGEFGYTRLHATKEKLTLSYVGNHDGEVHDMVQIFASGEVLSGGHREDCDSSTDKAETTNKAETKSVVERPLFFQFVKGASVLVLGAFVGYILGFVSRSKREAPASGNKNTWLPVKTEES